jgi:hypothetical protein
MEAKQLLEQELELTRGLSVVSTALGPLGMGAADSGWEEKYEVLKDSYGKLKVRLTLLWLVTPLSAYPLCSPRQPSVLPQEAKAARVQKLSWQVRQLKTTEKVLRNDLVRAVCAYDIHDYS